MEKWSQAYSEYLIDFVLAKDEKLPDPEILTLRKTLARSIVESVPAQRIVLDSIVRLYPVVTAGLLAHKKSRNPEWYSQKPPPLLRKTSEIEMHGYFANSCAIVENYRAILSKVKDMKDLFETPAEDKFERGFSQSIKKAFKDAEHSERLVQFLARMDRYEPDFFLNIRDISHDSWRKFKTAEYSIEKERRRFESTVDDIQYRSLRKECWLKERSLRRIEAMQEASGRMDARYRTETERLCARLEDARSIERERLDFGVAECRSKPDTFDSAMSRVEELERVAQVQMEKSGFQIKNCRMMELRLEKAQQVNIEQFQKLAILTVDNERLTGLVAKMTEQLQKGDEIPVQSVSVEASSRELRQNTSEGEEGKKLLTRRRVHRIKKPQQEQSTGKESYSAPRKTKVHKESPYEDSIFLERRPSRREKPKPRRVSKLILQTQTDSETQTFQSHNCRVHQDPGLCLPSSKPPARRVNLIPESFSSVRIIPEEQIWCIQPSIDIRADLRPVNGREDHNGQTRPFLKVTETSQARLLNMRDTQVSMSRQSTPVTTRTPLIVLSRHMQIQRVHTLTVQPVRSLDHKIKPGSKMLPCKDQYTQMRVEDAIESQVQQNSSLINTLIIQHLSTGRPHSQRSALGNFKRALPQVQVDGNTLRNWFVTQIVGIERALAEYYAEFDIETQKRGVKIHDRSTKASIWESILRRRVHARSGDSISRWLSRDLQTSQQEAIGLLASGDTGQVFRLITGVPICPTRRILRQSIVDRWASLTNRLQSQRYLSTADELDWSLFKVHRRMSTTSSVEPSSRRRVPRHQSRNRVSHRQSQDARHPPSRYLPTL